MSLPIACAKCVNVVCITEKSGSGPANCPIKTKRAVIEAALAEYAKPQIKAFARQILSCTVKVLPVGKHAAHVRQHHPQIGIELAPSLPGVHGLIYASLNVIETEQVLVCERSFPF